MWYFALLGLSLLAVGFAYRAFSLRKAKFVESIPISNDSTENISKEVLTANDSRNSMSVIYASQSGTAIQFAEELAGEAKARDFNSRAIDMEDFDPEQLRFQELVVFIVATYGEGDPTDSAIDFTEWIMDSARETEVGMDMLQYSVFGLGNKQYEFFNAQGIRLDKRLDRLGAKRVAELGLGDDDAAIDDHWLRWKHKFWNSISSLMGEESCPGASYMFEGSFRIIFHDSLSKGNNGVAMGQSMTTSHHGDIMSNGAHRHLSHTVSGSVSVPVSKNMELRSDSTASTKHLELDLSGSGLNYTTADNLGVFPMNDHKTVARVCKAMGVRKDRVFSLKPLGAKNANKKLPVPAQISIRDALLYCVDLTGPPKRKFLGILSQYAQAAKEKIELRSLGDGVGEFKDKYTERFHIQRQNIADIFEHYSSVKIPLEHLLELLPQMQPRYYTIASSSIAHPESVHVTLSVINEVLPNGKSWSGVCSTYMSRLRPGRDLARVFVRESSFRLPKDLSSPVIMIGPGSGIAPMRAFIQEGRVLKSRGEKLGQWILFFGCRNHDVDFLYETELRAAVDDGVLTELITAFSRDQASKVYVQHKLAERFQLLWSLISKQNASVYVCGSTHMGRDVRGVFKSMFQSLGGLSVEESANYLTNLQTSDRYIQELWG